MGRFSGWAAFGRPPPKEKSRLQLLSGVENQICMYILKQCKLELMVDGTLASLSSY